VPWRREGPSLGFGDDAAWLPQPGAWAELSVEAQEHDPASTLNLYREAIRLRRRYLRGTSGFEWTECGDDVLGFRRGGLVCIVNFGSEPHPVPAGKLILASEPSRDQVLPDSAIWLLEP
jgi:alpha-glucosidase